MYLLLFYINLPSCSVLLYEPPLRLYCFPTFMYNPPLFAVSAIVDVQGAKETWPLSHHLKHGRVPQGTLIIGTLIIVFVLYISGKCTVYTSL